MGVSSVLVGQGKDAGKASVVIAILNENGRFEWISMPPEYARQVAFHISDLLPAPDNPDAVPPVTQAAAAEALNVSERPAVVHNDTWRALFLDLFEMWRLRCRVLLLKAKLTLAEFSRSSFWQR